MTDERSEVFQDYPHSAKITRYKDGTYGWSLKVRAREDQEELLPERLAALDVMMQHLFGDDGSLLSKPEQSVEKVKGGR